VKRIAVVAADTHVEELIWRDRPGIRGDAFFGFEQIVDTAVANNLPLILAGDNVETLPANTPTPATICFLREQVARMAEKSLPVYAISGQHDKAIPLWLTAANGHAMDVDGQTIDIDNLRLYFAKWRQSDETKKRLQKMPRADVLVAHQSWKELMGGGHPEMEVANVPYVKTIISGDLHKPMKSVAKNASSSMTTIYSPGATHMRKLGEPTKHGGSFLFDDGTLKMFPIRSRVLETFTIDNPHTLSQVLDEWPNICTDLMEAAADLPQDVAKPIYWVQDYADAGLRVQEQLYNRVGDSVHLFYTRRTAEEVVSVRDESAQGSNTIADLIMEECGGANDLSVTLNVLISSDNMKATLREIRSSCLGE
jgi:hypothetical protein